MKKQYIFLIVILALLNFVSAGSGSYNWNFSTASDYTFNSTEIVVSGGTAYLNGTISTPVYAWWHLNENTGTNIGDSSGNNRNGTMMANPLWVAGKLNSALQFNGATNYVDFGNSTANFERTQAFSVELWLKTANTGQQILLSKMQPSGNYAGWEIYFDGTGTNRIVFDLSNIATTNMIRTYCSPSVVADNNWHHLIITYDGSSNAAGVKFYFDGSLKTSGTTYNSLTASILTSTTFQLSGRGGGTGGIIGILDEVVIYEGVLSLNKVTSRYNSGNGTESTVGDYSTEYYSIQPKTNFSFTSKLFNFTETATKTGGDIKYSVIDNGVWKYWNGASWATSNGNWTQSSSASDINSNIQTLASSGNFTFRAVLHSTDGTYTPYLDNIFTFYDGDAPVPSNINASSIGDTTATITWTTNENANSTINYGTSLSLNLSNSNSSFTTLHSTLLTGLSSSTLYFYNVTSCDIYENCGKSTTYNFTTAINYPPVASDINSNSTYNTATITWTTDENANSTINYGTSLSLNLSKSNSSFITSHSTLLTGLFENTFYFYNITSCDIEGNCGTSNIYNFTTTNYTIGPGENCSSTNKTFHWVIRLSNPSVTNYFNSIFHNQNIASINLGICTTDFNTTALNFTIYEEATFMLLNAGIDINLNYWSNGSSGSSYKTALFQNLSENITSNYLICFSPAWTTFTIDGLVSYYRTGYDRREYIFSNALLNNITQNIPLFLALTTSTDTFTFTILDEGNTPVRGAIIRVERWDIGTGNFYTVGMIRTDDNGQGIINLRLTDAWYRETIIYNGVTYLTTEPAKEAGTSKTLRIFLTRPSPYSQFNNIDYIFTYNNASSTFSFIYNDLAGLVAIGCLKVSELKSNMTTQIYYSCVASPSGTLAYTLTTNGTFIGSAEFRLNNAYANIYKSVKTIIVTRGAIERFIIMGRTGYVASTLLVGTLGLVGVASGSIFLGSALIIGGTAMSNWFGWLNIPTAALFSLVGVVILILISLKRRFG